MYLKAYRSILAGAAAMLLLVACGGESGGPSQPVNVFPKANAGMTQAVISGVTVTLDGTSSFDPDGAVVAYAWTQTEGPTVTLSNPAIAQPTFVAPEVTSTTALRFSLVVTDDRGAKSSSPGTVTIMVSATSAGVATVSGVVRYERVPFLASGTRGLNYAAPVLLPAREVELHILDAGSLAPLSSSITDANGAYSFTVPGNTSVFIRVMARTLRNGRWNVRVQDGVGGLLPYSYATPAFNSSTGTQDITLRTGIAANGTPIAGEQRASGPFAILDTIYTAMQTVLAVAPDSAFPSVYVDWGTQSGGTYFTVDDFGPRIALLSDLTEDTDEFDEHVVAHEFGHYLENYFSRSDSIGGPHRLGDQLDMRVAFGEGFGYAFAAMVLGNTDSRDSFINAGTHTSSGFDIEVNPPTPLTGPGCWCSEPSVWSILWDLYDANPDGADTIALGFAPIWQAMTGAQRTTPAMTSIFSFAAALKELRPDDAAGIDALLEAQNITAAGINAFAATQASTPDPRLLPLYPEVTRGGPPMIVASFGQRSPEQLFNKIGNRAFLRFVPTESGTVRIAVETSNTNTGQLTAADPDFLVHRNGVLVASAEDAPHLEAPRTETGLLNVTAGQTYIIEAYDCANGCPAQPEQGIAGDYTLTVTITSGTQP